MKRYFTAIFAILFTALAGVGCKSVAKYTIDDKATVKIDSGLLGIWKFAEDTDRLQRDYFLFQTNYDVRHVLEDFKYGSYSYDDNDYFITYMDHRGRNPHYQQWSAFYSKVGNSLFLNIGSLNGVLEGFIFVRILKVNATYDSMTTAMVADTTLKTLSSCSDVRRRIEKNANNPSFYCDTLHLYKVNGYHFLLSESILKAN